MPREKKPSSPITKGILPKNCIRYYVKDGDYWSKIANLNGISAQDLVRMNFQTNNAEEVNWYLRNHVGCTKTTADGKNWMFSSDACPGFIYIPMHNNERSKPIPSGKCFVGKKLPASKSYDIWIGVGNLYSASSMIGYEHATVDLFKLELDSTIQYARLHIKSLKIGAGLGVSVSKIGVIAVGHKFAESFIGENRGLSYDLNLGSSLKGLFQAGGLAIHLIDSADKISKANSKIEKMINMKKLATKELVMFPLGMGAEVWVGAKYSETTLVKKGIKPGFSPSLIAKDAVSQALNPLQFLPCDNY